VSLKHAFAPPRSEGWYLAGKATWKAATGDRASGHGTGGHDLDLTLAATANNVDAAPYRVHASAGWTSVGGAAGAGRQDVYHYGVASTTQFEEGRLMAFELTGSRDPVRGSERQLLAVSLGERRELGDRAAFDVVIRRGLTGPAPDWSAGIGLTLRF
jgi:hypothetical protein